MINPREQLLHDFLRSYFLALKLLEGPSGSQLDILLLDTPAHVPQVTPVNGQDCINEAETPGSWLLLPDIRARIVVIHASTFVTHSCHPGPHREIRVLSRDVHVAQSGPAIASVNVIDFHGIQLVPACREAPGSQQFALLIQHLAIQAESTLGHWLGQCLEMGLLHVIDQGGLEGLGSGLAPDQVDPPRGPSLCGTHGVGGIGHLGEVGESVGWYVVEQGSIQHLSVGSA